MVVFSARNFKFWQSVRLTALGSVFVLGACSFTSDALFPPVVDENPQPEDKTVVAQITPAANVQKPQSTEIKAPAKMYKEVAAPTSTVPGKKIASLGDEMNQLKVTVDKHMTSLGNLKTQVADDSAKYYDDVAGISAKLQMGTTRGNPLLVEKWNKASASLDNVGQDVMMMGQLAGEISTDEAMVAYLLDAINSTYSLSGAVDEDHANLREVEDLTKQLALVISRLNAEVRQLLMRQQKYVSEERRTLDFLSEAIKEGNLLVTPYVTRDSLNDRLFGKPMSQMEERKNMDYRGNKPFYTKNAPVMDEKHLIKAPVNIVKNDMDTNAKDEIAPSKAESKKSSKKLKTSNDFAGRRSVMIVKFDKETINYEPALYQVAKKALEKNPNVVFDVVEYKPSAVDALKVKTKAKGTDVIASLIEMGMPEERVVLSEIFDDNLEIAEVRIFLR